MWQLESFRYGAAPPQPEVLTRQDDQIFSRAGEIRWRTRPTARVGVWMLVSSDPLHRAQRDAGRLGHRPAAPVGRLAGRLTKGQLDHPLDHRSGQRRLAWRPALVPQQPVDALGRESFLPASDQTVALAQPTSRMIADMPPTPSPVSSTIRARSACFCRLFRSATIASSRARSPAATSTSIPLRMPAA